MGSSGRIKNNLVGAALDINGAEPLGHAVIKENGKGTTRNDEGTEALTGK